MTTVNTSSEADLTRPSEADARPDTRFWRFGDWRGWWSSGAKATPEPRKPYQKRSWFSQLLPGNVSRIHLYEAQECYYTLRRMLEYQSGTTPDELKSDGVSNERQTAISLCTQILDDAEVLLTRKQNDLNFLWRELARVRIIMVEQVLPSYLLAAQLDTCREEARRTASTDDPAVTELLQRLAKDTTDKVPDQQQREALARTLRALIERFTTIRTDRIHQQFVNIRTYQVALLILLPISALLITSSNMIVGEPTFARDSLPDLVSLPIFTVAACSSWIQCVPANLVSSWNFGTDAIKYAFANNVLFFVFFVGLTGGFFSVVIRLRDRDLIPGEDAYFVWYVLSKPFVGALGAAILFVLFNAELVTFPMVEPLTALIRAREIGPPLFGFAFVAGFSERLVFPQFR